MELLHEYHAAIGRLVLAHGGTLEHFAGDAVMVFFNDPVPVERPAEEAVRMALAMQEAFGLLAGSWRKRGYALALGRICPEKGFHLALDAAREAGWPLLLGGQVFPYPEHQRYFDTQIGPRLDRCRRYLGPVALARKRRLLAGARCLLCPSQVPETSALVAMEALACGTPVVALRAGSVPEVIEDGVTGFVRDTEDELVAAVGHIDDIDRARCRQEVERRFSPRVMAERYERVYRGLLTA
jgi:glycosyltransferase involved in cell wall biosynthesis